MMKLAFRPIEINGDLYFTQNCSSETSQQFSSIGLKRLGIMLVFNES